MLGGDLPLGLPLILDLERMGYVVITSVSIADTVADIERKCHGYVRALVLDPAEVSRALCFLHVSLNMPIPARHHPVFPSVVVINALAAFPY